MGPRSVSSFVLLDTSGSMDGEKLSNAKAAVTESLNYLGPTDSFTLLTFGGHVETVLNRVRMDDMGKSTVAAALQKINANDGTPLHGALRALEAQIDQASAGEARNTVKKVILLTDGQPNDLDPVKNIRDYRKISGSFRGHGASLAILAIGEDYNNEFLLAMYQAHEGGHYQYVESPEKLQSIFADIFRDSKNVILPSARLEIKKTNGVSLIKVYKLSPQVQELPINQSQGGPEVLQLGDIVAGENQEICIEAEIPARLEGEYREMAFGVPGLDGVTSSVVVSRTGDINLIQSKFDPIPAARFREARDKILVQNSAHSQAALTELRRTVQRYTENPALATHLTPGHVQELQHVIHQTELRATGTPEEKAKAETELRKSESRATKRWQS